MEQANKYIPGVCNIGPAEIRARRAIGWWGTAITVVFGAVLIWLNVTPWIRLVVFFPAVLGANGFLQAAFHFCTGFASRGLFNFSDQIGKGESIQQAEFRAMDRKKATKIIAGSVVIGIIVALIAYYL